MKTFKEFIFEARGKRHFPDSPATFSSREEGEKHHGGTPKGFYWNNASKGDNPKWRLKPSKGGKEERARREQRKKDLTHPDDMSKGVEKENKLKRAGLDTHHITPLSYSAKLKASMSDVEWEERKRRDAKDKIYHGHHPKNLMGAVTSRTPENRARTGIRHRSGGAHELESQTKDLAHLGHKGLLAAAHKKDLKKRREQENQS